MSSATRLLVVIASVLATSAVGCGETRLGDVATDGAPEAPDAAGAVGFGARVPALDRVPIGGGTPDAPTPDLPARALGLEINHPAGTDHAAQLAIAAAVGVDTVQLTMPWSFLEPNVGGLDVGYLQFGLEFYRSQGVKVLLSIPIVDTVALYLPTDLAIGYQLGGYTLASPAVIARAEAMIDAVLAVAGDELTYLVLSNEVNVNLATAPDARWTALGQLVAALAAKAEAVRPDVGTGVSVTYAAIDDPRAIALTAEHAVRFVTYYDAGNFGEGASGDVAADLDAIVGYGDGTPVVLKELGYATGPAVGGSEAGQAAFVADVFAAWDDHAADIPLVMFSRMFDGDRAVCEAEAQAYGLPGNEEFIQFLCSLGLRTYADQPKPAWSTFVTAAAARGFVD